MNTWSFMRARHSDLFLLPVLSLAWTVLICSHIWQVFTMNLSAPFICEFFKDVQEKCLP
jgi:hypothetical protein